MCLHPSLAISGRQPSRPFAPTTLLVFHNDKINSYCFSAWRRRCGTKRLLLAPTPTKAPPPSPPPGHQETLRPASKFQLSFKFISIANSTLPSLNVVRQAAKLPASEGESLTASWCINEVKSGRQDASFASAVKIRNLPEKASEHQEPVEESTRSLSAGEGLGREVKGHTFRSNSR